MEYSRKTRSWKLRSLELTFVEYSGHLGKGTSCVRGFVTLVDFSRCTTLRLSGGGSLVKQFHYFILILIILYKKQYLKAEVSSKKYKEGR